MKKEKKVKSYQRRTKSGKMVTVRAHTAKYDAAEKAKEAAKKKGAGKELEERKKRPTQLEIPFDKEEEKKVLDEVKGVEVSSMTGASLTRDAKLPKGITVKGSWRKISDAGTKGIGHSSWSSKADVFEATLSDGRKVTLHRTYGPAGETKVSYSSGESSKKPDKKKTSKKVRPVGSGTNGPTPKKKAETKTTAKPATSEPAFTAAEFKQWYHWDMDKDPKNKTAQKVAKVLRAQMGRAGYNKYFNEMTDNYSARGHISAYKKVSAGGDSDVKKEKSEKLTKMTPERKKALKESMAREASNRRTEKAMRDEYAGKISSQQRADIERKEAKKFKVASSGVSSTNKTNGTKTGGVSPFSGQAQLKQEMAMWKKSPTSAMGKASRNNITKLLQEKKKQGHKLTKREEAFLG